MKLHFVGPMCGLVLASAHAFAADMDTFQAAAPPNQQPVDTAQNWYLRGDIGVSFDFVPQLSFNNVSTVPPPATVSPIFGANSTRANFTGGVGVGYKFNDYIRADATFDYRSGSELNGVTSGIVCPYELTSETSQTQLNAQGSPALLGYAYDPRDTCNGNLSLKQKN